MAWSTVQECIEEDPQFVLSLAKAHVNGCEDIEDGNADGPVFEDDLAVSGNDLAAALNFGRTTNEIEFNDSDIVFRASLDNELTDNDTEGDTDSNPDSDADEEMNDMSNVVIWLTAGSEWPADKREYFDLSFPDGR